MSGRGRGRGRGKTVAPPSVANASFNTTPTPAPTCTFEPPPKFPKHSIAEPIDPSSTADILSLRFSEDLSHYMRTSPYYLTSKTCQEQQKIDRYSDKYVAHLRVQDRKGKIHAIITDLEFFPEELYSIYNHEKAQRMAKVQATRQVSFTDTLAKLTELERDDEHTTTEKGNNPQDGNDDDDDEDQDQDEVVYEEEELEDETDYNLNYFDNGEDHGDYDDGDEGPVY